MLIKKSIINYKTIIYYTSFWTLVLYVYVKKMILMNDQMHLLKKKACLEEV